jgi:RimJ/RimL family protein N-acetyltransferase
MLKPRDVSLMPVTMHDLPVLFEWINEREQVIFNAPYKPVDELQHQRWFESIQGRNDIVVFGIRELATGGLIGSCQLHHIHQVHRSAELQIRLGDVTKRGRGYGSQAVRLLLTFAFRDLNLHRVYLHVFSTNNVAIHLYQKVGFVQEGLLREAAYIDGQYCDVVIMGLLISEFNDA